MPNAKNSAVCRNMKRRSFDDRLRLRIGEEKTTACFSCVQLECRQNSLEKVKFALDERLQSKSFAVQFEGGIVSAENFYQMGRKVESAAAKPFHA